MPPNQNKFLQKQGLPPIITPSVYKNVSQHRRETLAQEVDAGLYRDGSGDPGRGGLTAAANVVALSGMSKQAQAFSGHGTGAGWRGGTGEATRQIPAIYSPLFLNSNLNLPRDRATISSWCRSFFALHPWVHNAINLHSTYPISKLTIRCPNQKVERFFNAMIEDLDLMNVCVQIAQEYWLLGEAFPQVEYDEAKGVWSRIQLQNPDYIVVKRSIIAGEPIIMLRPDENLRRIVFSNKPADIEQRLQLNPTIIEHVKRGENIPLDGFYVSHLARRISPYEARGTGLPVACFRQCMLLDQLREAKFAQAANMINPITLIKIGGGDLGYRPQPADLEYWRNVWAEAQYDPDYKIFTHDAVAVEKIGNNSAIIDINPDVTQLLKEIYMGLMVPSVLMDGGGDITYANGGVSLDVLRGRYMQFRNMMATWIQRRIFTPISKIQEFYEYEDGEKKLIVPTVEWSHMSIFDTMDYVNILVQMTTGQMKNISHQTLYRSLGLEYDEERRKMKKEAIQEAILKKEMMSLDAMALNELRALNETDDIPQIVAPALPGQSPYTDQSGQAPPGGDQSGGGGMGGGLAPLPGMPPPSGGGLGGPGPEAGLPPTPPTPTGGGAAPPPGPPPK
jgi:hypothetical protein